MCLACGMDGQMLFKMTQLGKRFRTNMTDMFAFILMLTQHMFLQMIECREWFITELTGVSFYLRMYDT